jgi:hypothetical protein
MLEAIVTADVAMRAVKDWEQTGRKGKLEGFISEHYMESKRIPTHPENLYNVSEGEFRENSCFTSTLILFRSK